MMLEGLAILEPDIRRNRALLMKAQIEPTNIRDVDRQFTVEGS